MDLIKFADANCWECTDYYQVRTASASLHSFVPFDSAVSYAAGTLTTTTVADSAFVPRFNAAAGFCNWTGSATYTWRVLAGSLDLVAGDTVLKINRNLPATTFQLFVVLNNLTVSGSANDPDSDATNFRLLPNRKLTPIASNLIYTAENRYHKCTDTARVTLGALTLWEQSNEFTMDPDTGALTKVTTGDAPSDPLEADPGAVPGEGDYTWEDVPGVGWRFVYRVADEQASVRVRLFGDTTNVAKPSLARTGRLVFPHLINTGVLATSVALTPNTVSALTYSEPDLEGGYDNFVGLDMSTGSAALVDFASVSITATKLTTTYTATIPWYADYALTWDEDGNGFYLTGGTPTTTNATLSLIQEVELTDEFDLSTGLYDSAIAAWSAYSAVASIPAQPGVGWYTAITFDSETPSLGTPLYPWRGNIPAGSDAPYYADYDLVVRQYYIGLRHPWRLTSTIEEPLRDVTVSSAVTTGTPAVACTAEMTTLGPGEHKRFTLEFNVA